MATSSGRSLPILISIDGGRKPLLRCGRRREVLQEAPAFLSAASEPPMLVGWVPRLAVAVAALLVIGGAVFASRGIFPKSSVQTNRGTAAVGASSNQSPPTVTPAETAVQANDVVSSLPAAAGPSSNQVRPCGECRAGQIV